MSRQCGIQHNHDSSIQNEQANVNFSTTKKTGEKTSNFFVQGIDKKVQFYSKILARGICERHNVMIHVQFRTLPSEIHFYLTFTLSLYNSTLFLIPRKRRRQQMSSFDVCAAMAFLDTSKSRKSFPRQAGCSDMTLIALAADPSPSSGGS